MGKKHAAAWHAKNPNYLRDRYLRITHGLTLEEYTALLEAQQGKCAICQRVLDNPKFINIDHNHATKKVRGILCANCNRALGLFQDSPEILEKAVNYLRGTQQSHG